MTAPDRPGDRDQQQAAEVDLLSVPGHDREVAHAMHRQSQQRGGITDVQVRHLLAIGYRAGEAAARADGDRLRQRIEALAEEWDRQGGHWTYVEFARVALDAE